MASVEYALRHDSLKKFLSLDDDEYTHYTGIEVDLEHGPYTSIFQELSVMALEKMKEDENFEDVLEEVEEQINANKRKR